VPAPRALLMRILVFSDIPPYVLGGAEVQAARLAKAWQAQGHEILVVGHRTPSGRTDGLRTRRLKVLYPLGRGVRALTLFLSIGRLMTGFGRHYDVAYCRFLGETALSLAMLKALSLCRIPVVASPAAAGRSGNADLALLRALPGSAYLIRLINRHCDAVNLISPEIKSDLHALGVWPRILSEIPNGVVLESGLCVGPDSRPTRLVFVGRLVDQKGVDILLEALARVRGHGRMLHLDLLGDGRNVTALRDRVEELYLDREVTFHGAVDHGRVQQALSQAHLFVLPSRYEGLSNAALEALAVGLPCVLTRCGGVDAYVDVDTGWVCEPDDVDGLVAALSQALEMDRHQWDRRSRRSRGLVEQHFELSGCARRHIDLFQSLLPGGS